MENRRVVITGLGVVSPVGNTIQDFWQNLCAGKSGVTKINSFDTSPFSAKIGAFVQGFDPAQYISAKEIKRMDKFVQYAVACSKTAVHDAGLDLSRENPNRIGVIIGSGVGGLYVIEEQHKILLEKGPERVSPFLIPMLITNMAPGQVAISLGLKGPNTCLTTACAAGTHAAGDAFRVIQRGDADLMLTGGTESCITPLGLGGFCAMKALSTRNDEPERASRPFDRNRDGFVMGEGAGIVLMEELGHALKRNARIYAEMAGFGMSGDAYHMTAPSPDGSGAARSMANAIEDAGMNPEDVSYINAHGTSTLYNDRGETMAIKQVFGDAAKKTAVSSTKSMMGHLLGASGGVELIVCVLAINNRVVPPTINYETPDPDCDLDYVPNNARQMEVRVAMSNSFGFGGHNAVLVVKKFTG